MGNQKYDITVIGAGLLGISICNKLTEKNHNIILIDKELEKLPANIDKRQNIKFINGDACEFQTLERAGISKTETVVSTTRDDKVNLVVSLLCKNHYNISTVIATVNNVENEWLFNSSWGVDKHVSITNIITSLTEESFEENNFVKLLSFGKESASLYEYSIGEKSTLIGKLVRSIKIPSSAELILIIRDGKTIKPNLDNAIERNDQLIFTVEKNGEKKLHQLNS